MNRLLMGASVLLLASALPDRAIAQCEGGCSRLMKSNGEAWWGCSTVFDSGMDCWATATRCTLVRCSTALLTTPEGRVVGSIPCGEAGPEQSRSTAVGAATFVAEIVRQLSTASYPARPVIGQIARRRDEPVLYRVPVTLPTPSSRRP